MKKIQTILALIVLCTAHTVAQNVMTPELLWQLGRVSALGISKDGKFVVYNVSTPNVAQDKSSSKKYIVNIQDGTVSEITNADSLLNNTKITPDGKYKIADDEVQVTKVMGKDIYPELSKSNVYVYDDLAYRHWDTWEDGKFSHVFLTDLDNGTKKDLLENQPYDCPTKPFGGDEDYIWSVDGKLVVYVTKKKAGKEYAQSTNTDLYAYDLATGKTYNLTEDMPGYDLNPSFNSRNQLAWLSMKRDGYEADKQDIIVGIGNVNRGTIVKRNLTEHRDDIHVEAFAWAKEGNTIYFTAPIDGTLQLFEVTYTNDLNTDPVIRQITKGDYDISGIVGQLGNSIIVTRTDMNHAAEIYTVDAGSGQMKQLTHVNDNAYSKLKMSRTERRMVKTTDGKEMLVWVIYPPDFDASKKYPALLYCQGGPQSPLTQFYSFRWNFQLMAANGYIVVAPNRRGMPGHGTKWNEQISKDWGGQVMKDYLSAIDDVSKETYVDKNRLGCVGASYGGYSVYYLAGIHNNRFKSFIAHDGVFDLKSMYGTTEELWFVNWDFGGPYWDKSNAAVQNALANFNPSNNVDKWNTPILIYQGGKDYRVPIEQGLQAFTAAQIKGIKSKLVYLPDENHWVLHAQNALVWQREFYGWLKETLK
ncbi:MAG: S9 family peptidase [Bacteroidetes bacterium]|nr:S9 family peptidase [Bacteroidota bacterium]